jgi:hypothetical protein
MPPVKEIYLISSFELDQAVDIYPYIRHIPLSTTTCYPRVPESVLCKQSQERCKQVASQPGSRFATSGNKAPPDDP